MKIGAFARQFGIPVDTIRYYVDNGILLTEKINNQHVFDEKCVRDMELVLELKRMRFSILEIQKMLSFLRVTNLSDPQDELLFLEWLAKKQHLLEQEVASLQQAIGVITQKRGSFPRNQAQESRSLGIPLPCFSWFCCPDCGKSLALNHARVMHNQVFHGELECACGYGCTIEEGIVVAPSANRSTPGSLQTDNPRQEFVSNTDPLYVNFSQKPVEWFRKRLRPGGAKTQGILLEIGTGLGFFLATFLENLGENGWYIATDASLAFLQYNKKVLERSGKNPNVLFLAADVTRLPLRQR
ncbi:MAG TPA: MerR family transcriptional regulator, partial [Thermotogota bacterium]|nr:MerR family transcriptional regulator [Thermotogota bacterium]